MDRTESSSDPFRPCAGSPAASPFDGVQSGFEACPYGVLFFDPDGAIVTANAAAARILGLGRERLLGSGSAGPGWQVIRADGTPFPEQDRPEAVCRRSGTPVEQVLMGVTGPGSDGVRWLEVSALPLFQPGEARPRQVMVTLHEVTASRLALQALQESEARFRTLFELDPDAVFIRRAQGCFLEANAVARQRYGFSLEEFRAMGPEDLTPPHLKAMVLEQMRLGLPHGRPFRRTHRTKAGAAFPVEIILQPMDLRGEPCTFVRVRDLSDETETQVRAELAQRRFEAALASATDPMLMYDAEGRLLEANEASVAFFRVPDRDALPRTEPEFFSRFEVSLPTGEALPPGQGVLSKALRGERCAWVERVIRDRASGATWTGSFSFGPILDGAGAILGALVTARDITERKHAERLQTQLQGELRALAASLRRAQEEERVRVAREIHDDLGQLLTALKIEMGWMALKLAKPGPPAVQALMDRVAHAGQLADTILTTVQRIALELRPSPMDQLGLEEALRHEARRLDERAGLTCALVPEGPLPALPASAQGDLFHLVREALTNVLRHAQATRVEVGWRQEGDCAVFTVSDDGIGMGAADLNATAAVGLTGMRERAALCGGTLTLEPNPPHGTKVTVRVPCAGPAAERSPAR